MEAQHQLNKILELTLFKGNAKRLPAELKRVREQNPRRNDTFGYLENCSDLLGPQEPKVSSTAPSITLVSACPSGSSNIDKTNLRIPDSKECMMSEDVAGTIELAIPKSTP
jgi:hypothetical protein